LNWKYKAALQTLFSSVPGGSRLNDLFRRHVTHGLPASDEVLVEHCSYARRYVAALRDFGTTAPEAATFFEFGAGSDLIIPLALFGYGVGRQTLVDIRRLVARDLVRDTARRLSEASRELGLIRKPLPIADDDLDQALERAFGIAYHAPCDARATGLPRGSIDAVTSTNTLEHIPPAHIRAILVECRRLLNPDGLLMAAIDYQDHYSYFDPSISAYNFLQFEARSWRKYSPSLQYQNRLRHEDYLSLIVGAGFAIVEDAPIRGSVADLELLRNLSLASLFRGRDIETLAIRGAMILARPL
jgi:SAM-dependent methyltransferase